MGWSGGSSLMNVIINSVKKHIISPGLRVRIYQPIVDAFNAQDWDTQAECIGKDVAFDEVLREAKSDVFDEEDDDIDYDMDDIDDEDDMDDADDAEDYADEED